MCLISVIVPVYKVEAYLPRCLDSILSQQVTDWEAILIDDGSPDRCGEICDDYAARDKRFHVIHQENAGLSAARNRGLEAAAGEYIAFVDSDDCLSKNYLYGLYAALTKTGSDIAECCFLPFSDQIPSVSFSDDCRVYRKEDAMRELIQEGTFHQVVWNKLYRRSVLEGLTFPVGKYHEDEYFTWRTFFRAETVVKADFCGYYYFHRSDSISGSAFTRKRLDALYAMQARTAFLKENMPSLYPDSCYALLQNAMYQYQHFLLIKPSAERKKCLKEIREIARMIDGNAVLSIADAKQKNWIIGFLNFSYITACLRNVLRIGL